MTLTRNIGLVCFIQGLLVFSPIAMPTDEEYDTEKYYLRDDFPNALILRDNVIAETEWLHSRSHVNWVVGKYTHIMEGEDFILGFFVSEKAYAIPYWQLKNYHVANLDIDDEPILVVLCEACVSAAAFNPVVEGTRLNFQVGGLYNGTHFLKDKETGSYWTSFLGRGLLGEHQSKTLEQRLLFQGTWQDWYEQYPDTFVSLGHEDERIGHGHNQIPGRKRVGRDFRYSLEAPIDKRLKKSTVILGVEIGNTSVAYELDKLDEVGTVINTKIADQDVVILKKPNSMLSAVFSPELDGRTLSFKLTEDNSIVDEGTNSSWSLDGEAVSGPFKGKKLTFIPSNIEEWYVWAAYHPKTEIRIQ